MRRRFRWNPEKQQMEEITLERRGGLLVYGDMEPFALQDGTVITGRKAWRDYCKQHEVTHVSDYNTPGGYWDKKRAERQRLFTPGAGFDSSRRKERIIRAIEKLNRR